MICIIIPGRQVTKYAVAQEAIVISPRANIKALTMPAITLPIISAPAHDIYKSSADFFVCTNFIKSDDISA